MRTKHESNDEGSDRGLVLARPFQAIGNLRNSKVKWWLVNDDSHL